MSELDMADFQPGEVIDADELDAKLIRVRLTGAPHFTGMEMSLIEEHYRKPMGDLTAVEMQVAAGYIYLRRVRGERVSWHVAENNVTVEVVDKPDPTAPASSET
jgi:hypothetical protein